MPEKFGFINNIALPSKYKLDNSYEVYTRENYDDAEYSLLHDYVFNCNKDYENNKWRTTLNSVVPFMLMLINKVFCDIN